MGTGTVPGWAKSYPRVQILTVAELLAGAMVEMPPTAMTFKAAARVKEEGSQQGSLFEG